jgi:cation diffusion facilitator family transporter
MSHQADPLKSVLYALGANFAIAVAKLVAAVVTNSGAMLAEGVHSLADCGNQGLLLLGMKRAERKPDAQHPLGYGKSIYFWSFIVAIMLFSMGGLFSVYEGIHKLRAPEPMTTPWIAIGVLLFAALAEGLSLAGCIREVNKVRGGRSFARWFHETRQSELLVVFGEDLAALLGLAFAVAAVGLTMVTGNPLFDAAGSIGIGVLLLAVAMMVGIEVQSLLIGQGVEPAIRADMLRFLEEQPQVERVFNLLTLQLGDDVMVAIKAQMRPQAGATALIAAINATEAAFRAAFPRVLWCFFEPDVSD